MFKNKKITTFVSAFMFLFAVLAADSVFSPSPVLACAQNEVIENGKCVEKCASDEIYVTIGINGSNCVKKNAGGDVQQNIIVVWLVTILKFLAGGVGIAVVGGIVWGGILRLTAQDNAAQAQKSTTVIVNSVIALIMFILMFAILNYIIPGGILT